MSLQYLKKEDMKGVHFLHAAEHQFAQVGIIVFDGSGQIIRVSSHVYCYLFPCTARL